MQSFIKQQVIREGANYSTNQPVHTNRLNVGCDELWCGVVVELGKIPIRLDFHHQCRGSINPNTINTKSLWFDKINKVREENCQGKLFFELVNVGSFCFVVAVGNLLARPQRPPLQRFPQELPKLGLIEYRLC